ncbi:MAG: cytochrome c-type biogenesis protein CcmH [Candidatus Dadabacteria bacterium]|nr:cytochrome c-type biogenesis protein CcmH [Candidatus Dadabacteria bacterium]MCZ6468141.1 cytochrome c-type biogenesis protein CcmH [Candidatus Dadabacteria bacterium]TDI92303.1 MAG: cytochrome c-type biogenesis protein CcmH [Candidatus Dadabacteria bacterium]TDJ02050.1 MAG: cytochrome c-type biogenesis protein CcmH [Candidatus Dadabacteria bacterium]
MNPNNAYNKFILHTLLITFFIIAAVLDASAAKSIDDQVKEIAYLLMCPVCQGQSVGESNSNLAHDMRDIIRKQLEEGKSKEEILAYFVNSYGESILASPPPKGINWLLWLLPGVAIVFGGLGIILFLYKSQSNKNDDKHTSENTRPEVDNDYIKRIEEELEKGDS